MNGSLSKTNLDTASFPILGQNTAQRHSGIQAFRHSGIQAFNYTLPLNKNVNNPIAYIQSIQVFPPQYKEIMV
jgi:phage-related protein